MKFTETALAGVYIVELEPHIDERGFFARGWCEKEFADHGLTAKVNQVNVSQNHRKGTVRGLHMQGAPFEEAKLVRCVRGAIFDVAVDLRPSSPNYLRWTGHELSAENRQALYVPEGFAHGYQTLSDDAEVFYLISVAYTPGSEVAIRHDDPNIGIDWPLPITVISDKDAAAPLSDSL